MRTIFLLLFSCTMVLAACNGQSVRNVGGACEGCEGLLEYGNKPLSSIDTLPSFAENEPRLLIKGTVYKKDGKTPASDIILYIYHTNRKGIYETRGNETGWAKRHGFIRGWVKTGKDGRYSFFTFRPAAYPDGREPEHIHLTVKEPGTTAYYLDDFLFDDDPKLTVAVRKKQPKRGGDGIVQPVDDDGTLVIERNIILGLNIPGY